MVNQSVWVWVCGWFQPSEKTYTEKQAHNTMATVDTQPAALYFEGIKQLIMAAASGKANITTV